MPDQIVSTSQSIWTGITAGFTSFMSFLPALLGAVVVLVVGWLISKFVAKLVERVLAMANFESAVARSHVSDYLPASSESGAKPRVSAFIGTMAKWFVFLIFVQAAANILRMPQVTAIINSVILFIPQLIVAVAILVAGSLLARYVASIVEASTSKMGVGRPKAFSLITRYAVMGFAVIAAVNQLGIATNLINILFTGLVASLALSLGLAFGLGGQGVASELTRSWYEHGRSTAQKLRAVEDAESKPKSESA